MRRLLAFMLAGGLVGTAVAQERPETTPTRDVDVVYRAMLGGGRVEQRSRFAPGAGKIRIDTPSPGLYVVVDRLAHTMDMVSLGDRSVLEMPYDMSSTVGGVPAGGAWSRGGAEVVANTPCTEWSSGEEAGKGGAAPTVVCVTSDGVMLRMRVGAAVLVQAVRVAYGKVEPSVFAIPADFRRRKAGAR